MKVQWDKDCKVANVDFLGMKVSEIIQKLDTAPETTTTFNRTKITEWQIPWTGETDIQILFDSLKHTWKGAFQGKCNQEISIYWEQCLQISYKDLDKWQPNEEGRFRLFGSVPFDRFHRTPYTWGQLNLPPFFLPTIEWSFTSSQKMFLRVALPVESDLYPKERMAENLRHICQKIQPPENCGRPLVAEHTLNEPDKDSWKKSIEDAKCLFQDNTMSKVVLSRVKHISLKYPTTSGRILKELSLIKEPSYLFAIASPDETAFIGRSPERLLSWQGPQVEVDAIAGTRERHLEEKSDMAMAQELKSSTKDSSEHRCVTDFVEEQLEKICQEYTKESNCRPLKLRYVHHMISSYQGTLKPEHSPIKALFALHPTPAVSGLPQRSSIRFIGQNEPFDRGLFAGTIGWTSGHKGDFAIGIRSALVQENRLRVYAGAGIVGASDPELEWSEVDAKMKPFMEMLKWSSHKRNAKS